MRHERVDVPEGRRLSAGREGGVRGYVWCVLCMISEFKDVAPKLRVWVGPVCVVVTIPSHILLSHLIETDRAELPGSHARKAGDAEEGWRMC